jgi:hypothetical protein
MVGAKIFKLRLNSVYVDTLPAYSQSMMTIQLMNGESTEHNLSTIIWMLREMDSEPYVEHLSPAKSPKHYGVVNGRNPKIRQIATVFGTPAEINQLADALI